MSVENDQLSTDSDVSTVTAVDTTSGETVQIEFEDKQLVARGRWALVYRAKLIPSSKIVAIKKIKETKQYKHREMEILRALPPHENVIRLRYYAAEPIPEEEDSRLLRLFMDYLPSNLDKVIKGYPTGMPLPLIQVYGRQLFSGLAHLAQRNIVHRDLLPRNILIDPSAQTLKLADFGCAKAVTPDVPNHPQVGAWQYRAVELLLGATLYDSKADVWSASVLILEMMSGKYPFAVTSEDNMIEGIITVMGPITMEQVRDAGVDPLEFPQLLAGSASNARRWSDVQLFPQTPSPELRSLLNLALEYSPRRRHDAASLLEHDFFKGSIQ